MHVWWKFHLAGHKMLMWFQGCCKCNRGEVVNVVYSLCLNLFVCFSVCLSSPAGVSAAGGGAAGGAGHWNSWGSDLHTEGGAGQTAGGAGRHQGPAEGDQQPADCTAGRHTHTNTHLFVLHTHIYMSNLELYANLDLPFGEVRTKQNVLTFKV